jgi:multiple sugar transport system permease protein
MSLKTKNLTLNIAILILVSIVAFPLIWMISVSFMAAGEASNFPPPILPKTPQLSAYHELLSNSGMAKYFANSIILASLATILSLTFNIIAGYAFAKLRFKGRDAMFQILLAALIVPAQVGMMPLFLMLKTMGLVNTYAGALVPWIASVFGIFMVRQFAQSIPDEMLEAARVDGANEWQIFTKLIIPNLTPVMVTLGLFTFLGSWNDFMWPLIILTDSSSYTLPVALAVLSREHVQDGEMMMAGAVITILPVLFLFIALQRFYMRGLLSSSVKG